VTREERTWMLHIHNLMQKHEAEQAEKNRES